MRVNNKKVRKLGEGVCQKRRKVYKGGGGFKNWHILTNIIFHFYY